MVEVTSSYPAGLTTALLTRAFLPLPLPLLLLALANPSPSFGGGGSAVDRPSQMRATLNGSSWAARFCRTMLSASTARGGSRGSIDDRVASVLVEEVRFTGGGGNGIR